MADEQDEKPAQKPLEWEKREFAINERMKRVVSLGILATEAEIAMLKRKLEKLQYGS